MAEWCWANVVRSRAADYARSLDARKYPTSHSRSLRTPSQAEVRNNLSTCPVEGRAGQVDRLVAALSDQRQATGKPIIENFPIDRDGVCIVRSWIGALAEIDPARPPADVPLKRWVQLIDDISRFISRGFAEKAASLGWTALDLFGCDGEKPFARIDRQGLCWLIAGNRVIDLSESGAVIETWTVLVKLGGVSRTSWTAYYLGN